MLICQLVRTDERCEEPYDATIFAAREDVKNIVFRCPSGGYAGIRHAEAIRNSDKLAWNSAEKTLLTVS